MVRNIAVAAALVVSTLVVACTAPGEEGEDTGDSTSAQTSAAFRAVDVIVSAKKTGDRYEARAYPVDDVDGDGRLEYYAAPVYNVYVDGVNSAGRRERRTWKTPRFMPYNNPAGERHDDHYKTVGFVSAGLSNVPRFAASIYKPDYMVQNRFSPFGGAIVVKGAFYIHAGPESIEDAGWGSAGCVEIIGNFDAFKKDILELAGSPAAEGDAATINTGVGSLIAARKLFITYEPAARPNIRAMFSRQVSEDEDPVQNVEEPIPNESVEQ